MKAYLKLLFALNTLSFLISCNNTTSNNSIAFNNENDTAAIQVAMEGKTLGIKQTSLEPQKAKISNDSILFEFWEDGNPLKLNFNLFNTDILDKGSGTYTIPDVNAEKQLVDLNFYNADRDAKSMNKRIIFRKGTITISKISKQELQMTFAGEGSGIMEYGKNFPISGKINVTY